MVHTEVWDLSPRDRSCVWFHLIHTTPRCVFFRSGGRWIFFLAMLWWKGWEMYCISCIHVHINTPPKFNSSPLKNGWLEDYHPFGMAYFQGRTVKLCFCCVPMIASQWFVASQWLHFHYQSGFINTVIASLKQTWAMKIKRKGSSRKHYILRVMLDHPKSLNQRHFLGDFLNFASPTTTGLVPCWSSRAPP